MKTGNNHQFESTIILRWWWHSPSACCCFCMAAWSDEIPFLCSGYAFSKFSSLQPYLSWKYVRKEKYLCTKTWSYRSINSNVILCLCPYLTLSPVDQCHSGSQSFSETWCAWVKSHSSKSLTTCFQARAPSVQLISGTKNFGVSDTLTWLGMDGGEGTWLV